MACGALPAPAHAQPAHYPVTIENCGRSLTFEASPERTVSIGQSMTEILYLLGLSDKVVGTALWTAPVLAEFEAVNATIKRIADNDPSFEGVLAERPDLVTTQFQWQVGPQGVVATEEQFAELGIPVYTSPADCVGKDNSGGGDGLRTEPFTMDLVYREIEDLAAIFDVSERGAELVADLKAREAKAREEVAGIGEGVSAVFWFSSAEIAIDPYVAGTSGAPGYIMKTLGIDNVIDSQEEWPTVGWETIARSNPTFIVLGRMDRRRFPADDVEKKREFLMSDPVTSRMAAVETGHVVEMDAQAMNPTIRTIEGLEMMAQAVRDADLGE
ncbi:ABC transporter substrate-binding protein [Fulvimarina endophytica]|uniref:ABC transporter substrate-binding protein n=1 Tax=Fulvimarina endophytica TaxID=2293836 RepID=A0A371X8F2_9HYPH|nr:ABC transporter substrate-binding protein [Fulvimarina endophytica]RFC65519.1 ABC transporter substrate-binding protein [Fulvimarina endophytica]